MTTARVRELAERLQGTCESIGDEQDDWTEAELAEFDDLVFCCERCGWWCEVGEGTYLDVEGTVLCDNCFDD